MRAHAVLGLGVLLFVLPSPAMAQRIAVCAVEWLEPLRFEAILRVEVGQTEAAFRIEQCTDTEVTLVVERVEGVVSRVVRVDDTAPSVRPRLLALMLAELLRLPLDFAPVHAIPDEPPLTPVPVALVGPEAPHPRGSIGVRVGGVRYPSSVTGAFRVAVVASVGRLLLGVQSTTTDASSSIGRIRLVATAVDVGARLVDAGAALRFQLDLSSSLGVVRARMVTGNGDPSPPSPTQPEPRATFLTSPRRSLFLHVGVSLGVAMALRIKAALSLRIEGGYTRGVLITESSGTVVSGLSGVTLGLSAGIDFTL